MRGLLITGTDTGVGKTTVGAALARLIAARGIAVRVRKPVETGCHSDHGRLRPADAALLQAAAGANESLATVCPYPFEATVSAERAARLAGTRLSLDDLVSACRTGVAAGDFLLVEGAGGLLSPLAERTTVADLARALGLPVLLVVPDRLGCLNHALLCTEALVARGLRCAAIVLNRLAPAHPADLDNADDLSRWRTEPVIALPYAAEIADTVPEDWRPRLASILPGLL
ncbi:MAG: dethiobiotin synthase [Pseudomonadota bacterium]